MYHRFQVYVKYTCMQCFLPGNSWLLFTADLQSRQIKRGFAPPNRQYSVINISVSRFSMKFSSSISPMVMIILSFSCFGKEGLSSSAVEVLLFSVLSICDETSSVPCKDGKVLHADMMNRFISIIDNIVIHFLFPTVRKTCRC